MSLNVHNDQLKLSEPAILIAVENFIIDIMINGFEKSSKSTFKELLELFDQIQDFDYQYKDYNALFFELKIQIDSIRYDPYCNPNADNYDFVLKFDSEQLKAFEQQIKSGKRRINDDMYQFFQQERDNNKSLETYMKKLFQHYSKLLIVRVDIAYRNDSKYQINIEQFYKHFEKMRNRLSNKDTCFEHLHGYAWALEQSTENNGGYHAHLLLIYDGAKVQSGSYYAQCVGEKWAQITQGHGCYFNLHNRKYIHELKMAGCEIGIGMVSRDKEGDWERLLSVINYLTLPEKDTQRLRVKAIKEMQTFGHGHFENSKRRGIKKGLSQNS